MSSSESSLSACQCQCSSVSNHDMVMAHYTPTALAKEDICKLRERRFSQFCEGWWFLAEWAYPQGARCMQNFRYRPIWLPKVLSTDKDSTKSASQMVKKVLFRTRKLPFSSSERCYFRTNICGSFPGPVLIEQSPLLGLRRIDKKSHLQTMRPAPCGDDNVQDEYIPHATLSDSATGGNR